MRAQETHGKLNRPVHIVAPVISPLVIVVKALFINADKAYPSLDVTDACRVFVDRCGGDRLVFTPETDILGALGIDKTVVNAPLPPAADAGGGGGGALDMTNVMLDTRQREEVAAFFEGGEGGSGRLRTASRAPLAVEDAPESRPRLGTRGSAAPRGGAASVDGGRSSPPAGSVGARSVRTPSLARSGTGDAVGARGGGASAPGSRRSSGGGGGEDGTEPLALARSRHASRDGGAGPDTSALVRLRTGGTNPARPRSRGASAASSTELPLALPALRGVDSRPPAPRAAHKPSRVVSGNEPHLLQVEFRDRDRRQFVRLRVPSLPGVCGAEVAESYVSQQPLLPIDVVGGTWGLAGDPLKR